MGQCISNESNSPRTPTIRTDSCSVLQPHAKAQTALLMVPEVAVINNSFVLLPDVALL